MKYFLNKKKSEYVFVVELVQFFFLVICQIISSVQYFLTVADNISLHSEYVEVEPPIRCC